MKNYNKLKERFPDLVAEYEAMFKNELIEQICAEVNDLHKMEERVSVFMEECTVNMSKTNYTPASLKQLISQRKDYDIQVFCEDLVENYSDEEILQEVKEKAKEI